MFEYVYKLNFPTIHEILVPGKFQEFFEGGIYDRRRTLDPNSYLKEEFKIINGYQLDRSVLFYKDSTGFVHVDDGNLWSINYIVKNSGMMFYYNPQEQFTYDIGQNKVFDVDESKYEKKYYMPEGVYLVRTDVPHMATAHGPRYCLSIRSSLAQNNISWEAIFDAFEKYII